MRTPYLVIALGVLVMGYACLFHIDTLFYGELITDVHVFVAGLLISVLGAREVLADTELGESW